MKLKYNAQVFDVKHCKNISAVKGLMFSKPLEKNQGLLLEFPSEDIYGIHTFFVFQNIDTIWLDSNFNIVDIHLNLKPFLPLVLPKKPAKYVLELRAGDGKMVEIKKAFIKV